MQSTLKGACILCLRTGCRNSVKERLCIKQAVLGSIPVGNQNVFNSVFFSKACEGEKIHLIKIINSYNLHSAILHYFPLS